MKYRQLEMIARKNERKKHTGRRKYRKEERNKSENDKSKL
jgi:hypothetical protein